MNVEKMRIEEKKGKDKERVGKKNIARQKDREKERGERGIRK